MADLTVSRKQRLRTLENQIRKNYEAFVATGFALKEIRDDELYTEDGFETWDRYLKERVGQEFGIEATQVRRLIVCAQVRTKLPNQPHAVDSGDGWSQRELLEFARLAPKDEDEPGQPFDFDRLDKRDANRVAKKVIEHCEKEGTKPTATIVRKFVDEDLGVDRTAKAQETKRKREEDEHPELRQFLVDLTGRIEAETEKLRTVPKEGWKLLSEDNPKVIKRLIAACDSLADLLRRYVG